MEDELGPPEAKAAVSCGYENGWAMLGFSEEIGGGDSHRVQNRASGTLR